MTIDSKIRTVKTRTQGDSVIVTIPYDICIELGITNGVILKAESIGGKVVYTPLILKNGDENK